MVQRKPKVEHEIILTRPIGNGARVNFLAIERIARLPDEQQADQLARLYRELSRAYMNWFVEGILSSHPWNRLPINSKTLI